MGLHRCDGTDAQLRLAVGVMSRPTNVVQRVAVRDTWAATAPPSVLHCFLIGAVVNLTFNTVVEGIPTYWPLLFAGVALFSFFFVLICLPETKQKSLGEVQALMRRRGAEVKGLLLCRRRGGARGAAAAGAARA